jgi:phospholipid/cholesterol/gamma-HCH transport system substrate-binding protein
LKEEIKAGIIIIISLIILSGFIILIGGSQIFEKLDTYYVKVNNTGGLEVGAPVRLGGVRVGRVISVKIPVNPGQPVTIKIGVKKGTALFRGTKASITQVGLVGDIYLLLSVENTTNERIKVGEVIPSTEQVQFDVLMSRLNGLSQSVDSLIKDMDKIFSEKNVKGIETLVDNTNKAIVSGSANLNVVASSLKGTADKLQLVLNEVEDVIKTNKTEVSQLLKKAKEDLEQAKELIKSLETASKSIEKTSKSADKAINMQSQNLGVLLDTLTKTTEELQELLQEIKNKPWSIIYKERKEE